MASIDVNKSTAYRCCRIVIQTHRELIKQMHHFIPTVHVLVSTCDGVMGEGFDIGQVIVRTVFLEPLADVLLSPQHHRFGQTGQRRACVIHSEGFTWMELKTSRQFWMNRFVLSACCVVL